MRPGGLAADPANLNPASAVENDIVFEKIEDFILIFTSILWEALPFIVLGALIAGLLEEFVPQQLITRDPAANRRAGHRASAACSAWSSRCASAASSP